MNPTSLSCISFSDLSMCVFSSASSRTISFYNKDTRGEMQKVSFDNDHVKKVFHGSFHKVELEFKYRAFKGLAKVSFGIHSTVKHENLARSESH